MALQNPSSFQFHPKFEKLSFQYEPQLSVESNPSVSTCSTPSTPGSPIDFDIKIATGDDKERIRDFLQRFFYKDEPLNSYLELINDDTPRCYDLEKFTLKDLDNGLNLLAVHDEKLIGVCLNGIIERGEAEEDFICEDEKFCKIVKLLQYIGEISDPFQKYPGIDKAIVVKILSVDDSYRGKGIAKDLMSKTIDLAKEKGCGFCTVDCTSHYTARAARKLGFELHYTLKYEDYKVDGNPVFDPAAPHKAMTVYTQKIY